MSESTITLALCPKCGAARQIGSYRRQFCSSCGWTRDRDPAPEKVMCCAECENPLSVTKLLGGSYCTHCNYVPSRHDLVLIPRKT